MSDQSVYFLLTLFAIAMGVLMPFALRAFDRFMAGRDGTPKN